VYFRARECEAGLNALRLYHINILSNIRRPTGGQQEGGERSQWVTNEHRIAAMTQGSPWVTNEQRIAAVTQDSPWVTDEHRIAAVTHREEQYAHGLVPLFVK
jgi:hypothetical protein